MLLSVLAMAFALAFYLSLRGVGAALAIPVSTLLVPAGVLFQAFIFPGDPELAEHWLLAALVGVLFGLLVAGFGYFIAPMMRNKDL
jgi:hypothetical protein